MLVGEAEGDGADKGGIVFGREVDDELLTKVADLVSRLLRLLQMFLRMSFEISRMIIL